MAEHYFSQKPDVTSEPKHWSFDLRGYRFRFKTDHGVFSKNEVDYGSRVLIYTFEEPNIPGPILDVGCGYGPIGLSLAKTLPTREIHMIDINERAVRLAKDNAQLNNIDNVVIFQSDLFENVKENSYAAIVTNPPIRAGKQVVFSIFENSYHHLKAGGELWVVIQKKQGAPSAKKKLEELFGNVTIVKRDKGYYILKAEKV